MKRSTVNKPKTDADILKEIEELVKTSQEERNRKEGNYVHRRRTPYGKYEEVIVGGKKKQNNYFLTEKKVLSSSLGGNLYASKNGKDPLHSVDELLRTYAVDMRNQEKHHYTEQEVKVKLASVPHIATEQKVDAYLTVNPKPNIKYSSGSNRKNYSVFSEDNQLIEVGKADIFSLEQLDSEILEAGSASAIYPNKSQSLSTPSSSQSKDRLKHISAVRLRKKYPRFCSNLTFTDIDLKNITPRHDKWISKFMEICYDEAAHSFNSEGLHGKQHYYEGMNLGNLDNFPFLVQRILTQYFSVLEVRKRVTLEVLYTLELLLERSEIGRFKSVFKSDILRYDPGRGQLFSKFLSEEYDVDILAVFLHGRLYIQNTLGKKLKDVNPARIVIPKGNQIAAERLLESRFVQQRIEQQQIFSPNSKLNPRDISWFSTTSGENNAFLTNLQETDNYLHTTFTRSLNQSSLPPPPVSSSLSTTVPIQNVLIQKVVPIELPAKWYYLTDITLLEAPVVGFHESLLWYFICLIIPSPPAHYLSSSRPPHLGLANEDSVQQVRQYFMQKVWDMASLDIMKDTTNHRVTKTSGLHQIPTYTLLRAVCHEWKKLSKEEKAEFSYEGLLNDSLKSLNAIYENNCAKLKVMEQSVLDCESNLVLAKSKVSKLEKELKRYERKLERKIALGNEVLKIAALRDELTQAKNIRQDCEHKVSDTLQQKKKLLKTTEELWGVVMARANKKGNKTQHFGSLSPTKDMKKQLQEAAAAEEDLKASFWKNYVTFMFNKILEKNLQKEITMKQTQQESKQIIAKLESTNKLIKPSAVTTLYNQPIHANEIMKSAIAIEKLLVETMARIFVRTVINDGKRKVLLSHHLNIRQHELLLLYGGEEYLRQEQERKLKKRLAEAAAQREKELRSWIHHLTPVLVSEIIDEGKKKAFDSLYDPYWMLDLSIRQIVGSKIAQIVENRFKDYLRSLVILAYRKMALPVQYKRVRKSRQRRLVKKMWKKWMSACSMNSRLLMKVKKLQRCIRCFLWTCRNLRYLKDQRRLMAMASNQYESNLRLKQKPFFTFWWKYLHLHRRYTKTKFALAERRFLICFYTWKDKFIKLRYQKMKLSKLQTDCCILIQSIIRQFIAKRRVSKLLAKRKITSWIQIVGAKRFRQRLKEYRYRIDDFYHLVVYNNRFSLLREAYRLWKRSYNILLGLAKLGRTKNHYQIRCRYLKWIRFANLKTKYLAVYAIKIQSVIRMFLATRRYWQYHRWRRSLVKLQSMYRKHRAVYYFSFDIYYYRRAKLIQKIFRGYKVRKNIYLARIADIHVCAFHNKYERLKHYCEKYPELIYRKDEEGNTPLHTAAKAAAKRTMKLLIKHMRLNPNEVNNQGYTALHLLIMSSAVHRDEIFHYVLERGFDDDQLTASGKSCVLLAAEYNRMVILKKLLDDGHDANLPDQSGLNPIQCACSQGNLAMLQLLIENEGNVHQSGMNGTYPVHDCITGNNIEVLYALLREQIDVNVTDPMYSQTPLMWAAQAGLGEFCRTLIIHNADIQHKDYQGRTVAHYAAMCNVSDVYHALREADVEFDVVDGEGNSPLHLSAYYGTVEMAKNILHGGVYPSYQNDVDGEQPSHIAAKYNQLEILQLICEYDEYIGRPNFHHQTPLGLAKFYNCMECIDFLEKHYRMVDIVDGRNALGEIWWDKQIDEEVLSAWEVIVQPDGSRIYVNKVNGERSLKPPSVKSVDLVKDLAKKKNALPLRRVIELVKEEAEGGEEVVDADGKIHKSKNTLTKHEYYLEYRQNKEDIKLMSIDYRAATTIVKFARRKLAYMEAKRLRLLKSKKKVLRRFYRIYIRAFLAVCRVNRSKQANKMQQVVRGYLARKHFFSPPNGLYYRYRERRAKRILRYKLWDMYCFYRFMKETQLKIAIKHHFNYTLQDWQIILDKVRKPLRTINIYEEYKFPNMVNLKFYRNVMTGNCFFIKPKEIIEYDENMMREERERKRNQGVTNKQLQLIVKLQSLIRGYIIRTAYRHLERALHICQYAKQNYLEAPEKDVHVYNYALYCLVMEQDIDRARSVFLECLRRMQWRGPDNAFVLYSYAIFGLKSGDEDMTEVRSFVERANKAEKWKYDAFVKKLESQYSNALTGGIIPTSPLITPREAGSNPIVNPTSTNASVSSGGKSTIQPFRYGRIYDLAKAGFFRYAATVFNNSYGWECHALCMFLVYRDFNASFDAFMQAFKTDPSNKHLRKNFDLMMISFHGKDREKREAIINERMRYLASLDNEIEENRRRARERQLKRETSARKIQRWYKDRRAIRNFNRFLQAVQMNMKSYGVGGKGSARKKKRQNLM